MRTSGYFYVLDINLKIDQSFYEDTNIEKVGYTHKKGVQKNDQNG